MLFAILKHVIIRQFKGCIVSSNKPVGNLLDSNAKNTNIIIYQNNIKQQASMYLQMSSSCSAPLCASRSLLHGCFMEREKMNDGGLKGGGCVV